jgi:hypothetical protein
VDDIFFGSSDMNMCNEFEKVMKNKFEMSAQDLKYVSNRFSSGEQLLE